MSEESTYAYWLDHMDRRHQLCMNLTDEIILCNRQLAIGATIRVQHLRAFLLVVAAGMVAMFGQLAVAHPMLLLVSRFVASACWLSAGIVLGRAGRGTERYLAVERARGVLRKERAPLFHTPPPLPAGEGRPACH